MEAALSTSNVDPSQCRFITNGKVRAQLRNAPLATDTAKFVWDAPIAPGMAGDGSMLGYSAWVTNQALSNRTVGSASGTCSSIFLGDWSEVILAQWGGGIDLTVDIFTGAATRLVNIYAALLCDVGLRHTEAIAVLKGIVTG